MTKEKIEQLADLKWLNQMVSDKNQLYKEDLKRRKTYRQESVDKRLVGDYIDDGYEIYKELVTIFHVRKQKKIDEILEDRVWHLFYLMGYHELSSGRQFKVKIKRPNSEPLYKQIDVLAKDDETIIVTECKASKKMTKDRSLQSAIEEFANLKGPIGDALQEHYGKETKLRIIWLFVTYNLIWSDNDKKRASGGNIKIIKEDELRYYLQNAEHLRGAARFQFLAEFFKGTKIPGLANVTAPAIRGKLGGKTFYTFVSTPKQILKIAFINHRTLNDPEGEPTYQRLVEKKRLKQISKFIKDGGYFPNNILVNFISEVNFDKREKDEDNNITFGNLHLPNTYRSVWVIDGQHRLYGYAPLDEEYLSQNIMVTAFESMNKREQANLFLTINHTQKSVKKSLLDDLEGELKWGSEIPSERIGAMAARLINILNHDFGEPFNGRVTQIDIKATEVTCLTLPLLKEGIKKSGLIGKSIFKGKELQPGPLSGSSDFETLDRARSVLNGYFGLIANSNKKLWEDGRSGYLCINVSIQGYLLLLSAIIRYMEIHKGLEARHLKPSELLFEIEEYFEEPILNWLEMSNNHEMEKGFKGLYGTGGPKEYFFMLCKKINEHFHDFSPEGFSEWLEAQSEEKILDADKKIKELNIEVQKYIFNKFKEIYGTKKDAFWNKGVLDKNIQKSAFEKSLEVPPEERLHLENYLNFIQYKQIVENKVHWDIFKPQFNIPMYGQKGQAKNLKWMDRINEMRRIPGHATQDRQYNLKDYEDLDFIYAEFMRRLALDESKTNNNGNQAT